MLIYSFLCLRVSCPGRFPCCYYRILSNRNDNDRICDFFLLLINLQFGGTTIFSPQLLYYIILRLSLHLWKTNLHFFVGILFFFFFESHRPIVQSSDFSVGRHNLRREKRNFCVPVLRFASLYNTIQCTNCIFVRYEHERMRIYSNFVFNYYIR